MYANFWKRVIDLVAAVFALILFSPFLLILTIAGAIAMGGNPFFVQKRTGKISKDTGKEKIFSLIKFRTMNNKKDAEGNLLPDEVRLNKYGRFLRSTSCDELPQLINILLGDLSVIGPRPLIVPYLDFYTAEERCRHNVRPGLTGLAQVNGRSFISWEEIFAYDVQYANHITLGNDVKIFMKTIAKVFRRNDIADMTQGVQDEEGKLHLLVNGKEVTVHQPLNVERSYMVDNAGSRK